MKWLQHDNLFMPSCNFGQHSDMLSREVTKPRPQIFVLSYIAMVKIKVPKETGRKGWRFVRYMNFQQLSA
jgi:hypothetical protein